MKNNAIRNVLPSPLASSGTGQADSDPEGITKAWGTAAFDTKGNRYLAYGGGHHDYAGNEVYAINVDTLVWYKIFAGSDTSVINPIYDDERKPNCSGVFGSLPDNLPIGRHPYDGVAFLPDSNAFWMFSGSMACPSGSFVKDSWIYRLSSLTWKKEAFMETDTTATAFGAPISDYDPVNKRMLVNSYDKFKKWDVATNAWTTLGTGAGVGDYYNGVYVPSRKKFYMIGGDVGVDHAYVWDMAGAAVESTFTTYGDTAIAKMRYPGAVYDPVSDRIVAWAADGGAVYDLNLDTRVWTRHTPLNPGKHEPPYVSNNQGVQARWQYVPSKNVFMVYMDIDDSVYFYKLPKISRRDLNLNQWTAIKPPVDPGGSGDPNGACPGGGCKHVRITYNPVTKTTWWLGGDYANALTDGSSANYLFEYDVGTNVWTKKSGACPANGDTLPGGPDEVGFPYDSTRNVFWLTPGYMPAVPCTTGANLKDSMMIYDPVANDWHNANKPIWHFYKTGTEAYSVYDPYTQDVIELTASGKARHMHQDGTVTQYPFGVDSLGYNTANAQVFTDYLAFAPERRVIYAMDPGPTAPAQANRDSLFEYHIDTHEMRFLCAGPDSTVQDQSMLLWDSINKVLLWPQGLVEAPGPCPPARMNVYHPETNTWEENITDYTPVDSTGAPMVGSVVFGRVSVFDPNQNVVILVGGNNCTPDPYIWLYRYGNGTDAPAFAAGGGGPADQAPEVTAPAAASVYESSLLTVDVTASDPDQESITSLTAAGTAVDAGAQFSAGGGNTSGSLTWTPNTSQAGSYAVTFTAANALSGTAETSITVNDYVAPTPATKKKRGKVNTSPNDKYSY